MKDIPARSSHQNSEHHTLIASDRIEGTAVRTPDGRKIGRIKRVMIDKADGKVVYAILARGGFLGVGERYLPLDWNRLAYHSGLQAYKVDITADELEKATSPDAIEGDFDWGQRDNGLPYYFYMTN
jgi:sporulation protein YlmC with PRC-barrel domain